jgi:hypothetical protein
MSVPPRLDAGQADCRQRHRNDHEHNVNHKHDLHDLDHIYNQQHV